MTDKKKQSVRSIILLAAAGSLLYAVSAGIRQNYGVLMTAIAENSGVSFATVSFIVAVGKLVFGVGQPAFGAVALKKSNRFVMVAGSILAMIGLIMIPFCKGVLPLLLFLGIILPAGTGALSFGTIMGALTPLLAPAAAAAVSGIVSGSSGLGNIVLSPVLQSILEKSGLRNAVMFLVILAAVLIPISVLITSRKPIRDITAAESAADGSIFAMIGDALKNRNFVFLTFGFFTCGFHMGIVEMHYYNVVVNYGFSEQTAAFALSIFGVTSILSSLWSGALCSRIKMKNVLSLIYGIRAVLIPVFIFILPKTAAVMYIVGGLLGLIGTGTIPPTSGLTEKFFGPAKLALLFGFCFMVNQIGAFISVWAGGVIVSATGSYDIIWLVSMVLCAVASVICGKIRED